MSWIQSILGYSLSSAGNASQSESMVKFRYVFSSEAAKVGTMGAGSVSHSFVAWMEVVFGETAMHWMVWERQWKSDPQERSHASAAPPKPESSF